MVKNPPANAGDSRDVGLIPGLGRSPGGGYGNPLVFWPNVRLTLGNARVHREDVLRVASGRNFLRVSTASGVGQSRSFLTGFLSG